MGEAAFLAVDWGTTNRRVYAIDAAGAVVATERDDHGVLAIAPGAFAAELAGIRDRFGDRPVLCAGMVGSVRGWVEVPYLRCPADLGALAHALHWVEPRTAIVPGLSIVDGGRGDVMRGEEVQLLGSVPAALAPPDALLCQPGTHCKWAWMADGRVDRFRTTMTGEMFALLRGHSLLADFLKGEVADGPAFREGVAAAADATLLTRLFGVRADALLGLRARENSAAFVSGLLIGSDVREQALAPGQAVHILADPALGALYAAAIAMAGGRAVAVDSQAAFVAGITAIWRMADAPQV
ncbi:MAG: 2-dehydro-3-deoxygalactonokinase [Sphingomonas bacterium]